MNSTTIFEKRYGVTPVEPCQAGGALRSQPRKDETLDTGTARSGTSRWFQKGARKQGKKKRKEKKKEGNNGVERRHAWIQTLTEEKSGGSVKRKRAPDGRSLRRCWGQAKGVGCGQPAEAPVQAASARTSGGLPVRGVVVAVGRSVRGVGCWFRRGGWAAAVWHGPCLGHNDVVDRDVDELDEEADEAHHEEPDGRGRHCAHKLFPVRLCAPVEEHAAVLGERDERLGVFLDGIHRAWWGW